MAVLRITTIIATSLAVFGSIFSVLCVSNDFWNKKIGGEDANINIWLYYMRVISIASLSPLLATIALTVVSLIKENSILFLGPLAPVAMQALLMFAAMIIYIVLAPHDDNKYSWSFALGWIGVLHYVASAAVFGCGALEFFVLKNRNYRVRTV